MPQETRTKINALYNACCEVIKQLEGLSSEELAEAKQWHSFVMSLAEGMLEDAFIALKKHNNNA